MDLGPLGSIPKIRPPSKQTNKSKKQEKPTEDEKPKSRGYDPERLKRNLEKFLLQKIIRK